jgi:hypothetical protein
LPQSKSAVRNLSISAWISSSRILPLHMSRLVNSKQIEIRGSLAYGRGIAGAVAVHGIRKSSRRIRTRISYTWQMLTYFVRDRAPDCDALSRVSFRPLVQVQTEHLPVLCSVPCIYKRPLRLVRIFLRTDFLYANFCAVLGEDDVLLLQLVDAALGEFVCV